MNLSKEDIFWVKIFQKRSSVPTWDQFPFEHSGLQIGSCLAFSAGFFWMNLGIGNLNLYAKSLLGDGVLKPLRYEDTKILLPNNFRAGYGFGGTLDLFRFSQIEEALVAEEAWNGWSGTTICNLVSNPVRGRVIYNSKTSGYQDHDFASKNCHLGHLTCRIGKTNDGKNYRHSEGLCKSNLAIADNTAVP